MGRVDVIFGPAAVREVKKMSKDGQKAIIDLAESLRGNMHPAGTEKIQGRPRFYRLRRGDYRIIYCPLSDERAVVLVAADRREAYRNIRSLDQKMAAAEEVIRARRSGRS
jgi:mRNA interferase RelE/StbE